MASLADIKNWFRIGLKPTQTQFWSTWDSFWHKDTLIPQSAVENLEETLASIGSGGRFGIEDKTTTQNRTVDLDSNKFLLTRVDEFEINGSSQYQLIENDDNISFFYNGGELSSQYEGKSIVFSSLNMRLTENGDPLTVQIREGKAVTEYDFIETQGNIDGDDFYIYQFEPMISEMAVMTGYYGMVDVPPRLNFNLPEENFNNNQKIVVYDPYNGYMSMTTLPTSTNDGPSLNDVTQEGNWSKADIYVSPYSEGDKNYIRYSYREIEWHTGSVTFSEGTSTKIRAQNHVATQNNIIELPAGSGTIPLSLDGEQADIYGNIKSIVELTGTANNMNVYPYQLKATTYFEYIDKVDTVWNLPKPEDCLNKTIVIITKGYTIKLLGAISRGIDLTELNVTVCATLKAYSNDGSPKWFVINEVKL